MYLKCHAEFVLFDLGRSRHDNVIEHVTTGKGAVRNAKVMYTMEILVWIGSATFAYHGLAKVHRRNQVLAVNRVFSKA